MVRVECIVAILTDCNGHIRSLHATYYTCNEYLHRIREVYASLLIFWNPFYYPFYHHSLVLIRLEEEAQGVT